MIISKYEWKIDSREGEPSFLKIANKSGMTDVAANIAFNRGIDNEEALSVFLKSDLSQLHSPFLLNDMEKAVSRLRQAIENNEQILIYGDYDADGMTSATIVKEALEMLGAEPIVYLPNRFTDGYGPNQSVYKYYIDQQDVSVILTVDNGVAGHEAILYAQSQGVDVIVTDHHSMPNDLPQAFAIVHPEHPKADYPFKDLAGCGVAFKLACALLESIPTELLDLVAIGTIADMVSLTDENRIMVKVGLAMLKQTERVGLLELLKLSDVDLSTLNEETIGFIIAPQLNALGRLDDPNPAIELLTGFDEEDVTEIAHTVKSKNEERKVIVQDIFEEALAMVNHQKQVQVLAKEGWHQGVLGIVAGRIMEKINQPVVLLNIENGVAKGSARSLEGIDIFAALDDHREIFTAFGGHSGAAGMTLPESNVPQLSDILCSYVAETCRHSSIKNTLTLDEELALSDINLETLKSLEKLGPFGMGNQKPVFWLRNFTVVQARTMGQGNAHLKLKVSQDGASYDVLAFNQGKQLLEFQQVENLELAVTLSVNDWNGATTLQLVLEDARVHGIQLYDIRAKNAALPDGVPELASTNDDKTVLVGELPETAEELMALFKGKDFEAIYFKNIIKAPFYLTGCGTREQYKKLYKTISHIRECDVRYKLKDLSHYLKIEEILLIKMIQIFEELDFVTITDGIMTINKEAKKRDISESSIYQKLKETIKYQELMALGTPQEIYSWLKSK